MPKITAKTVAEHRENKRALLLMAAQKLLVEGGAEKLNFGAIADRAGLARTSVYEYFKNKSELLLGLAEEQFAEWYADVELSMERPKTPEKKIEAFFNSQIKMIADGNHNTAFSILAHVDDAAATTLHAMHLRLFSLLAKPLEQLNVSNSEEAMLFASGVLHSTMQMARTHSAKPENLADHAARFVLGGLKNLVRRPTSQKR